MVRDAFKNVDEEEFPTPEVPTAVVDWPGPLDGPARRDDTDMFSQGGKQ